jgi:hypothetical protein
VESDSVSKLPHLDIDSESNQQRTDAAATVELSEPAEVDVELEEPAEVELNEPAEVETHAAAPNAGSAVPEEKDDPPPAAPGRPAAPFGAPDPMGLRAMLAQQPELLEPGLSVYTSEKGTPLGAGYTSAVGEIDLLAKDADGGFVVVMVAEPYEGEALVSGVLQRIGWVRKHLCAGSQAVRGIVLMDQARDEIVYAAAAVADTVSFKTYQVALTFSDLEF